MIGEFVSQGDDAVAGLPVDAAEELRKRGRCGQSECDIGTIAADEMTDQSTDFVDVVEPGDEVGTGEFIAVREVFGDRGLSAPGNLSVSGGVQVSPPGQRRKFRAD